MNQLEQLGVFFSTRRKSDNSEHNLAVVAQKQTKKMDVVSRPSPYACAIKTIALMRRKKVCKERSAAK